MKSISLATIFVTFCALPVGVLAGGASKHGANLDLLPPPKPNLEKGMLPGTVKLESPKALARLSGPNVTLTWKAADRAESYHVQVAKDSRFKWLVHDEHFVNGTSYEAKGLEAGQQYFWRVWGKSPANDAGATKGPFTFSSFEIQ